MKDKKNILIGGLLFAIVIMAVGYAAFATQLDINGTATISGEWDVEITNIESAFTGTATDLAAPEYTATTATFSAKLLAPGDAATYTVTVTNKGSIDAELNNIKFTPQTTEDGGSAAILYTVKSQPQANDILKAGETATVVIEAKYDPSVETVPEVKTRTITGVLNYVQATK